MKTISISPKILQSALNSLNERNEKKKDELQKQLQDFEKYEKFMANHTTTFHTKLFDIAEVLKNHGFEIESVNSFVKTGYDSYQVKENDKMKVSLSLKMCGRRKPLAFHGYTSSGEDKRRGRMDEIINGVDKEMEEKLNLSCQINPYSLERATGIICEIWL